MTALLQPLVAAWYSCGAGAPGPDRWRRWLRSRAHHSACSVSHFCLSRLRVDADRSWVASPISTTIAIRRIDGGEIALSL